MRFSSIIAPFFLLSCSFLLLALPTSTDAVGVEANVCVSVMLNLGIALGLSAAVRASLGAVLNIRVCLCLSAALTVDQQRAAVRAYINGITGIGAIIGASSEDRVISAVLNAYINGAAGASLCPTPAHGRAICDSDRTCGVQCDTNFVFRQHQCQCRSPFNLCGDVCSSSVCPSPGIVPRRNAILRGRERCTRKGHTFCPAQGSEMGMASGGKVMWECLSTDSGLESCGGCPFKSTLIAPLLLSESSSSELPFKLGQDCSAIPFVDSVSCLAGRCLVDTCAPGWKVTKGRDGCEKVNVTQTSFGA